MIINPQRNSNTLVQASSLNGGNLAQSFNLQCMSIINAYFRLIPPKYTNSSGRNADQSVLLNEASGAPIVLPVGACIVSIAVGIDQSVTFGNSDISGVICYGKTPVYNYTTNVWEPSDNTRLGQAIIGFGIINLQNGIYQTPFSNAINAYSCLLAFMGGGYHTFKPEDAICKVKLLIVNPSLAQ
jgi:hypothetical protein